MISMQQRYNALMFVYMYNFEQAYEPRLELVTNLLS